MLSLASRILHVEGFASYRYGAGWCHEPDPQDNHGVSRHANEKAAADPILPRYPPKPLYGVFKCNHLVAFLQLLQSGALRLPGNTEPVNVPSGQGWDELREVLEHGIEMEVFSHEDVTSHHDEFAALMASDNFASAFAMAEDEFTLLHRLAACAREEMTAPGNLQISPPLLPWDCVLRKIMPTLGNRWTVNDVSRMLNYATSTDPGKVAFVVQLSRFMMDSNEFRIIPSFFQKVTTLPVKYQALRLAFMVANISSDPEKETKEPACMHCMHGCGYVHPTSCQPSSPTWPHNAHEFEPPALKQALCPPLKPHPVSGHGF